MSAPLGTYIKAWRERRQMTQTDFAEEAGMPRAHVAMVESGRFSLPDADRRRRIAAVLGVSHADLLVIAGELGPDEIAPAPLTGFPPGSPQERVVELVRDLPDDLAARLVTDAQTLVEIHEYRRQLGPGRAATGGGIAATG